MLRFAIASAVMILRPGSALAQTVEAAQAAAAAAATAKSAADSIILTGPIGALFILVVIGLVVACGVLGIVIHALWKTITARDLVIASLQDKRATDASTSSRLLAETATAGSASIAANTVAQAELTNRMQAFADLVRPLGSDHGRIMIALDRNAEKIDTCVGAVGECTTAVARIRGAA